MMATRSLNVIVSANAKPMTDAFRKGGKDADRELAGLNKRVKGHARGISKSMLGAAAGVASLAGGIAELKSSVKTVESLAKGTAMLSRTTGMDNKSASEWVSIAKTRGVEAKALNMGFVSLAKNMKAAGDGSKQSVAAFKELGVSQAVLKRGDTSEVINRVADAFAKMPDGANKAALAQKLFSRQAGTLMPLLNKGSDALKAQLGIVDKYGATLDAGGVKQANKAIAAQRELGLAWQGVQVMLGTKVVPVIATGARALATFVSGMRDGTGAGGRFIEKVQPIVGVFKGIYDSVSNLVRGFRAGNGAAVAIVATLAGLGTAAVVIKGITVVTKAWAAAQLLLNAVMTANPIGLIIVGVAALAAGLVVAYKKSETFRNIVNGAFNAVKSVASTVIDFVKAHWLTMIGSLAGPFGLVVVTIIKHFGAIKDRIGDVVGWFRDLPGKVLGAVKGLGEKIAGGIVGGLGQLGHMILDKLKAAIGWVADKAKGIAGGIGKVLGIGDGIGKTIGSSGALPSGGAFGGSLMGARSAMRPFAAIGSGFGLHVSSGRRPGSITSSGNRSWHSTGEAIDEAGPAAGMLRYFRYLKSRFGGRLAELIYTPGGQGVKDGRPFTYTGQVARDHFDHVHVAFDSGAPGLGDGIGRAGAAGTFMGDGEGQRRNWPMGFGGFAKWARRTKVSRSLGTGGWTLTLRDYASFLGVDAKKVQRDHGAAASDRERWKYRWTGGEGDGLGRIARTGDGIGFGGLESLWVRGGGTAKMAPLMAHVAQAESGGDPKARNPSGASGLWQILGQPFKGNVFDPLTNAKMAVWKYKHQGLGAWAASRGTWGRYVGSGETYAPGHGGGSKSKGSGKSSGGSRGTGSPYLPAYTDAEPADPNSDAARAQAFLQRKAGKAPARPLKGLTSEEQGVIAANRDAAPTEFDYLDSAIATAGLTPGTEDDKAALTAMVAARQRAFDAAWLAGADPRVTAEAARNLKSATDALEGLTNTMQEQNALLQTQNDLMKQQRDAANTALNVSQSQYGILAQAIAEIANQTLGAGLGLSLSGLRSPAGSVARA
jgi:hypothetical protein